MLLLHILVSERLTGINYIELQNVYLYYLKQDIKIQKKQQKTTTPSNNSNNKTFDKEKSYKEIISLTTMTFLDV